MNVLICGRDMQLPCVFGWSAMETNVGRLTFPLGNQTLSASLITLINPRTLFPGMEKFC